MITTPIFTRLLSTSEYGYYSVYTSWQGILTVFVTLNLSAGVFTRGLVKNDKDVEQFTSSFFGLSAVLSAGSFVIYFLFRSYWNSLFELDTLMMVCMLISMWNDSIFGFWAARQRVAYRYKALVALTLVTSIVQPCLAILGIYLFPEAKVQARVASIAIVGIFAYWGLAVIQIHRNRNWHETKYWNYAVRFNVPLIPHYLSQSVLSSSDRIMISRFCSESDAGIYSLAYSLSMLMTIVNTAVTNTFSPWLYKNIQDKKYDRIGHASYLLMVLIAAANLCLIAFAPEIVAIFAPPEYAEAIWIIPPVAMTVFFMFMYTMFANFSFYYAKTSAIAVTSCLGATLNIILNAIFIPLFGYIAAAYTTLVCYIGYTLGHYYLMKKIAKDYMNNVLVYNKYILLSISAASLGLAFGITWLYPHPILRYCIIVGIFIVIYMQRKRILFLLKEF